MLPSETMIWQPEFTDKTLSRKPGAVQRSLLYILTKRKLSVGYDCIKHVIFGQI
ncbi:PapI protein [Shigella flexneri]|nr:PapI protein [Shigella flexneri]